MFFAGHETFHLRDGWLYKGLSAIHENPMVFSEPHPTDSLGVGRNMVNAIRYWLVASGLAVESRVKVDNRPKPRVELSWLGKLVRRYDPYLEEDLTLWVIHYNLAANLKRATTWFWLFNKFPMGQFDSQSFVNFLSRWVSQEHTKSIAVGSLQKDFSCLIRTYTSPSLKNRRVSPEESFECPLASLRLIDHLENTDSYRLSFTSRNVATGAMGYAVLSFLNGQENRPSEIGLKELATAPRSPGRVFLMSSDGLIAALGRLEEKYGKRKFSYVRTAGMNLLRVHSESAETFLANAYQEK